MNYSKISNSKKERQITSVTVAPLFFLENSFQKTQYLDLVYFSINSETRFKESF